MSRFLSEYSQQTKALLTHPFICSRFTTCGSHPAIKERCWGFRNVRGRQSPTAPASPRMDSPPTYATTESESLYFLVWKRFQESWGTYWQLLSSCFLTVAVLAAAIFPAHSEPQFSVCSCLKILVCPNFETARSLCFGFANCPLNAMGYFAVKCLVECWSPSCF